MDYTLSQAWFHHHLLPKKLSLLFLSLKKHISFGEFLSVCLCLSVCFGMSAILKPTLNHPNLVSIHGVKQK